MSQEPTPQTPAGGGAGGAAAQLPNINAQTNPFGVVFYNLSLAAYIQAYSKPHPAAGNAAITSAGKVIGVRVQEELQRFEIVTESPGPNSVRASNRLGQRGGSFTSRWMFIPEDLEARPQQSAPGTELDPTKSQRFEMLDGKCSFGDGEDTFEGFGTGRTYPTEVNGQPKLMAAAAGTILSGTGKFQDKIGTYTYNGDLTAEGGFQGDLLIRVMDPDQDLMTDRSIPLLSPAVAPEPGVTYLLVHGQKANEDVPTNYVFNPDGSMKGFKLWQEIQAVNFKWSDEVRRGGSTGLGTKAELGQLVGTMTSEVFLDLLNLGAPGTQLAPIPFGSHNEFFFKDANGKTVGSLVATGGEGRTWGAQLKHLPNQQALRFGAFQLLSGTGVFEGVQGLLTDNSIVGVAPHVTLTAYTFRLNDPDGRYRAAIGG